MTESISQAIQGVLAHKMRSFLTMLGIIIGIASIITIISGIKGTNEQIKENLIGAGNNVVTVQLYQNDMEYDMSYNSIPQGVFPMNVQRREELRELDGVQDVSFYHRRSYAESVFAGNTQFSGNVYGIDDSFFAVNDYRIRQGRGFIEEDYQKMRQNLIVDENAAKTLFGSETAVGKIVEISAIPYTVVGVAVHSRAYEPVINSVDDYYLYADLSGGSIFLPDSTWPIVYRFDEPQSAAVRAESTDDMTVAGKSAADYLTEHQIASAAKQGGFSYRSDDLLKRAEQLQELSNATNKQLIWIACISLLVGGIGVMNIMLVSVTERTNEIGLRKAIGAKRRRILAQFLTEAAVLTGIGGLLGVLVGIGLSKLISVLMKTPSAISVPAIIAASLFSVVIGVVFGIVPAVKASKLNPIEALRRE